MELVPILSTIILVGTIATFILAVAAYILYKIRERRARDESRPASYAQPDPHVLVAPQLAGAITQGEPAPASMYAPAPVATQAQPMQEAPRQIAQAPAAAAAPSSLFWEYTDEGFVPVNPQEPVQAPREAPRRAPEQPQQDEGYAWL